MPPRKDTSLAPQGLLKRKTWSQIPCVIVLFGEADFYKRQLIERIQQELFGEGPTQIESFTGPANDRSLGELPLARVLDELRTPSFFAPRRLVIIHRADAFLSAYNKDIAPFLESGFGGGWLVLSTEKKPDQRTRFAQSAKEHAWTVSCQQPFDRPPPWESHQPVWESPLSNWVVEQARGRGLNIDTRTAFALHDRLGTDLIQLDQELDKLDTLLASRDSRTIDEETILASTGDLREDSWFSVADAFLEGRRADTFRAIERLFERGYHQENGQVVLEPTGIALPLLATLSNRLRSLRRAHALNARGESSEAWIRQGLVRKPFLPRFERQMRANSPRRIAGLFERIYKVDRSIKTGGDARRLTLLLVAE